MCVRVAANQREYNQAFLTHTSMSAPTVYACKHTHVLISPIYLACVHSSNLYSMSLRAFLDLVSTKRNATQKRRERKKHLTEARKVNPLWRMYVCMYIYIKRFMYYSRIRWRTNTSATHLKSHLVRLCDALVCCYCFIHSLLCHFSSFFPSLRTYSYPLRVCYCVCVKNPTRK